MADAQFIRVPPDGEDLDPSAAQVVGEIRQLRFFAEMDAEPLPRDRVTILAPGVADGVESFAARFRQRFADGIGGEALLFDLDVEVFAGAGRQIRRFLADDEMARA